MTDLHYHNAFTKMPNADYTGNVNYRNHCCLLLQEVLHISELFFNTQFPPLKKKDKKDNPNNEFLCVK